ncbi:hypothetical protein EKO27_g5628 [Xylaria grammica]|uniref:Uncharacterized protein n=1 Tax=Xylaria grammica TaxID=363999 RepID=A0A439D4X6_9PEZI|nr:hypothetical protein EKO27_g5628 [Xylaria grammica]
MFQHLDDDGGGGSSSSDPTMGLDYRSNLRIPPKEPAQTFTMSLEPSGWVPVNSSDSEGEWCYTPSVGDTVDPAPLASHHPVSPPSNSPNNDLKRLTTSNEDLKEARAQVLEQYQGLIEAQGERISNLQSIIDNKKDMMNSLEAKLFDSFVVMTQSQQHELDRLQKRLLDLQTDAEEWLLGHEWRGLQQKLHTLNYKLDGYIKSSTLQAISTGEQTDELTLFMNSLLGDLPKMWNGLEKLERDIEEEKVGDTVNKQDSSERVAKHTTDSHTSREDVDSANTPTQPSVTDVLNRYYEFSRLQRERMITRKEKLQSLLDEVSAELSRLQADLAYEEGRTASMRTRMMFWEDDLGASKVVCPVTLLENLEMKQMALKKGSQELEKIAGIIQELPSHFHMIEIRAPGEDRASCLAATKTETGLALSEDGSSENYKHRHSSGHEPPMRGGIKPSSFSEKDHTRLESSETESISTANHDMRLEDIHDPELRQLTTTLYSIMSTGNSKVPVKACQVALERNGWRFWDAAKFLIDKRKDRVTSPIKSSFSQDDRSLTPSPTTLSSHPATSTKKVKQASEKQAHTRVSGRREDTLYIAELEAKLKEKQDNEKAWASLLERLQRREKEAKTALQKRIDSTELGNAKLRKAVQVVAGRLFEHRERLWGLSTPAREMGEELISTLEQLEISCEEPLIYE